MQRLLELEPFEMPYAEDAAPDSFQIRLEKARRAAYEQGHSAGWDSATATLADEARQIRERLVQSLAALHLTHGEARRHVLLSIEPLLNEMISKLLPTIARGSIAAMIVDELMSLAGALTDSPLQVTCAPSVCSEVEALLAGRAKPAVRVVPDPSLPEDQARLISAQTELRIDLGDAIASIGQAVTDFFDTAHVTE